MPERTAAVLDALGLADEPDVVAASPAGARELGLETRLSRARRARRATSPAMADEAHAIRRLLDNNPRDISRDEILALYRAAYR